MGELPKNCAWVFLLKVRITRHLQEKPAFRADGCRSAYASPSALVGRLWYMDKKIVLHIADRDLVDTLLRVIEGDDVLGRFPIFHSEQVNEFDPRWMYVIDCKALDCPRVKEMAKWKKPHVVLMVQPGDSSSFARAWDLNIHKVVERTVRPEIMRLALVSEAREVA